MSRHRSRRPLTIPERTEIDSDGVARLNYVLRRYGGLDVYIPRINTGSVTTGVATGSPRGGVAGISTQSSEFSFTTELQRPAGPFGNFIPLFGGRIVLGPERSLFILSSLFLVAVLILIIIEQKLIEEYCGGPYVFVLGSVLSMFSLCTFLTIGVSDPGVVPKNYTLQELVAETEDYRTRHPNERFYRYCQKCRAFRPPRTFHCSRCDVCIRQQDLHLFTGGICIGERNRRAYLLTTVFQSLQGIYLIVTNCLISIKLRHNYIQFHEYSTEKAVISIIGGLSGIFLIFLPQTGILMFIYRMYLVSVGRTAREEYRKYRYYDANDCVVEHYAPCVNIMNFFFRPPVRSVFRRRLNRVDPEGLQAEIPTLLNLERILGRPRIRDSHDLIRIPNFHEEDDIDLNANTVTVSQLDDAIRLRELAEYARGRSTPSVPLFEQEMNVPTMRIRVPRKSKPSNILQQKISAFQEARGMPKATVSYHRRHKLPLTLSEGCIPRTKDGLPEMIQLARATQLRRIIQMILLRDRTGLLEMSRRVNIAALVGMNRFDPDNLQLLELNNGLPMIAPRRREAAEQGANQHRLGAGVLGIPQMVAAGLLPTARDLASSVELMVGRGRIRRLPPVGRQRYVPITVVDPPSTMRRALNINDIDLRNLIAPNVGRRSATITTSTSTSTGTSTVPDVGVTNPNTGITNDLINNVINSSSPTQIPQQPSIHQQRGMQIPLTVLNNNDINNNGIGLRSDFVIGGTSHRDVSQHSSSIINNDINDQSATAINSNTSNTHQMQTPPQTTLLAPFANRPGHMVVIPVFTDSE